MPKYWTVAAGCIIAMCIGSHLASAQSITPTLSPDRIDDVPIIPGETAPPFPRFDDFSWRAFIALNWPAQDGVANRGQPDRSKTLGDLGPRVWETFKARYEVFAPEARKPAEWSSYDGSNPCGGTVSNQTKTLSAYTHFADYNQASSRLNVLANPLVDQSRMYTRYEVRFNRELFDTIVDDNNKWYVKNNLPSDSRPGTFKDGSIELKAAWRVLKAGDTIARERFYITKAMVFDAAASQAGSIVCHEQDVALVGLHIVIKTKLRPQWIWSSFEHIDNVPPKSDEPDAKNVPVPYSFNSGQPPAGLFPPANQRPKTISDSNPPNPNPDPMQVVRLVGINPKTMETNRNYWALPGVKGTVWANYMLVMTQWPTSSAPPSTSNDGGPFPTSGTNLANTTMETYQQGGGASCMECHQSVSNAHGRDFVAFMGFDASDPVQQLIAMAATRMNIPGLANSLGPSSRMNVDAGGPATQNLSPARSALDDDPAVSDLVRMLQRQ
jgi:hypothetical protein